MALDTRNIKLIILDFDGVLTDNFVYLDEYGDESVRCCKSDSVSIDILKKKGFNVLILTGEKRMYVRHRSIKLGVHFRLDIKEKEKELDSILKTFSVDKDQIIFVGNDLNDLGLINSGIYSACPSDAVFEVKENVDFVLKTKGGHGVVRELFSILKVNI